jgi:hypothetical protein
MFTHPTFLALYADARHQTDLNPRLPRMRRARALFRRNRTGVLAAGLGPAATTSRVRPS